MDYELNRSLAIGDKITFIIGDKPYNGIIKEKNSIGYNHFDFVIVLDDGKFIRKKSNNLEIYKKYEK